MTVRRHDARLKAKSWRTGIDSLPSYLSAASRMRHSVRTDEPIKVVRGHEAKSDCLFSQRCSIRVRSPRNRRCALVADRRGERRHQHQRALHELANSGLVSADAGHTVLGKRCRCIGEQTDRLQCRVGNNRLVDVEFEVTLTASKAQRAVVYEHQTTYHGKGFALCWVDLARHD